MEVRELMEVSSLLLLPCEVQASNAHVRLGGEYFHSLSSLSSLVTPF